MPGNMPESMKPLQQASQLVLIRATALEYYMQVSLLIKLIFHDDSKHLTIFTHLNERC